MCSHVADTPAAVPVRKMASGSGQDSSIWKDKKWTGSETSRASVPW
jgi:hypothetical protein